MIKVYTYKHSRGISNIVSNDDEINETLNYMQRRMNIDDDSIVSKVE
jgi:hypothetical protein